MKTVNANELRNINGGYHYHCAWCCSAGESKVDFYTEWTGYLHTLTLTHKLNWRKGKAPCQGKCRHKRVA